MRQNSKKFKSHARANSFVRELIESGKLDVQIWGLPEPDGKIEYYVLWNEK